MRHIDLARKFVGPTDPGNGKNLLIRTSGQFYTHKLIGNFLISKIVPLLITSSQLKIIDPFAGDGRLIRWLLDYIAQKRKNMFLEIHLWDYDFIALQNSKKEISAHGKRLDLNFKVIKKTTNTFAEAQRNFESFDVCVTNPPWDILKPDRRELNNLNNLEKDSYIQALKKEDKALRFRFPNSQPVRRFAGWGTNLARVGLELSLRLIKPNGVCGIVSPVSLLADQNSAPLRAWFLENFKVSDIAYYPPEARLFEKVDQPVVALVLKNQKPKKVEPNLFIFDSSRNNVTNHKIFFKKKFLKKQNYTIPIQFGIEGLDVIRKISHFNKFKDLEKNTLVQLWAGREVDETNHKRLGS